MLDRIQKGFELQKRFISDASHELRTPVTVIAGYADMLDRWGKDEPDALTEGVEAIKSEAANMHSLIEKLLFLARTDKGKQIICRIPFQLEELIEEVYRETCLIAPQHQVIMDRNDTVIVLADKLLLKQMLCIFIENSIKFTPSDGLIRINSEQDGSFVEISIKDTGIGIANEDLLKIFDRFYRVDKSRTKTTGGNGLGLSIAKWIAEQHQCEISVSSTVEEGTTVRVKVPIL
jgi:signal transduction histidine kinase